MSEQPAKVLVAGANGMVGSAVCRALERADIDCLPATRTDADLTDRAQVKQLLAASGCDCLVVAAAKVGGIHANDTYPAEFIYENLMIEANLIDAAYQVGIDRIVFLGSSCIYPRDAEQPMTEHSLLTGRLEPTNEPYAIAKIAGIKLCESYNRQYGTDYRSLMPTNLYGPGDNFHPANSHVIPALMRRFHEAKLSGAASVSIWGSGKPRREFLHVDDLAESIVHVISLSHSSYWSALDLRCSHVNVGTGEDITIAEVAKALQHVVGLDARLVFDTTKPDGTPRKLLNVETLSGLGWRAKIDLHDGLLATYQWFLDHESSVRR